MQSTFQRVQQVWKAYHMKLFPQGNIVASLFKQLSVSLVVSLLEPLAVDHLLP